MLLRHSEEAAWFHRWSDMLAVASQSDLAVSLVEPSLAAVAGVNGPAPSTAELFAVEAHLDLPLGSCLQLRG